MEVVSRVLRNWLCLARNHYINLFNTPPRVLDCLLERAPTPPLVASMVTILPFASLTTDLPRI